MKPKNIFSIMLALFLMVTACMFTNSASAQTLVSSKPTTDTLANTDTATITTDAIGDAPGGLLIQVTAKKINGTMAGKVFLYTSANAVDYILSDSLILTDVSRSSKIFSISTTTVPALKYRAQFVSSGTCRYLPELYILRRKQ
jgi:hypothetical protein